MQGELQLVGLAVLPADVTFLTIDAEAQAYLLAGCDRRNPNGPARAIVVARQNVRIVLETPAGDHGL